MVAMVAMMTTTDAIGDNHKRKKDKSDMANDVISIENMLCHIETQ